MSFLTLDGLTVPVAVGGVNETNVIVGSQRRAYGGSMRLSVRARKKEYSLSTTPMLDGAFALLEGVLIGTVDLADFETNADTQKGIVGNSTEIISATAADGDSIEKNTKFGSGALEQAQTYANGSDNYLASDERLCQNSASAKTTALGSAVISDDGSNFYQNSLSVKVVSSASSGGVAFDSSSIASGVYVRGSVWVKGSGSVYAKVYAGSLSAAGATVALSPTEWRRVDSPVLVATSTGNGVLFLYESTGTTGVTFYCGRATLCPAGHGLATVWADGAYTIDFANYSCADLFSSQDAAVSVWFRFYADEWPSGHYLIYRASSKHIGVDSNGHVYFSNPAGNIVGTVDVRDGEWHNVTAICRSEADPDGNLRELWLDGVKVGADSNDPGDISTAGTLYIGSNGTDGFGGAIDSALFFDGVAPGNLGAALYTMGTLALTSGGFVEAAGDLIGPKSKTVSAEITSSSVVSAQKSGAWRNNLRAAKIKIREK